MASKLVANRAAVIRSLTSSIEKHGDPISVPLTKLLFPDGVPPNLTIEMLVKAMGDAANRGYQILAAADVELAKELTDDEAHRNERDDAVADARVEIQRSRGAMIAGWGPGVLVHVGLDGELPEDPSRLEQLARAAGDLIETAELGEPAIPIDRGVVAARLRESAARVDLALTSVAREEREAQDARTTRDGADASLRRVYVGFADAFAGFAIAVGRDDVASRVRTTARRRAGLPEEGDILAADPTVVSDPVAPADPTPADPKPTDPTE